ncbi:hypothetical protein PYW08_005472 [Mythimna loreyi]|uniref:Uncharacterized protein n=1 Tax=Mythimna loreyi TaxID=667449 RepID=A0ACC2QHA0_9NEOP|nr:hypothetical protein PYW08_005472 [Mythimna loreyi]
MEITELVQRGPLLNAKLSARNINESFASKTSPEYVIGGVGVFQMRVMTIKVSSYYNTYDKFLFFKFTKRCHSDELNFTKTFTNDDDTWHLIHENGKVMFNVTFNVSVEMHLKDRVNSFAVLYEDTELTDFEMRGEDRSVRMHRAVMAAASPVLRRS